MKTERENVQLNIEDLVEYTGIPANIIAISAIVSLAIPFLKFIVYVVKDIAGIKGYFPYGAGEDLKIADSLKDHGKANLSAAFLELYEFSMIRKYAKRKTGHKIPSQVSHSFAMVFILLACMILIWWARFVGIPEPWLSILILLVDIGLLFPFVRFWVAYCSMSHILTK